MKRTRALRFLALLAVVVVAGSACAKAKPGSGGTSPTTESDEKTITINGQTATSSGTKDVTGMTSLEFEIDNFYFSPTVLEGTAGQTLTLEAKNEGDVPHTFTVDSLSIDQQLQPDDTANIEVTFPQSGVLLFYCRFHQDKGMRGGLSVGPFSGGPGPVSTSPADSSGGGY